MLDGLAAAVPYYGGGMTTPDEIARQPKVPVLAHFGDQDHWIPLDSVEAFKKAHPEVEVHLYRANHGFNCDQRGSYNAASGRARRASAPWPSSPSTLPSMELRASASAGRDSPWWRWCSPARRTPPTTAVRCSTRTCTTTTKRSRRTRCPTCWRGCSATASRRSSPIRVPTTAPRRWPRRRRRARPA